MASGPEMEKSAISRTLRYVADLMDLADNGGFRARSFRAGARALDSAEIELSVATAPEALRRIPGIGEALAAEIVDLVREGRSRRREGLEARIPPGVIDLLRLPGVGPKKVRTLWRELALESLEALERACAEGRVASLKGFGPKSEARLLEGARYLRSVAGQVLLPVAEIRTSQLVDLLRSGAALDRIEVAGELRRRREVIGEIVLVAACRDPESAVETFLALGGWEDVRRPRRGEVRARLPDGLGILLRAVEPREFGSTLLAATGSAGHLRELEELATGQGLASREAGLDPERPEGETEEEIYRRLGIEPIPPELREGRGEVEFAARGELPRLVRAEDVRGVVHVHTTYSDGRATLAQMLDAARSRGYRYLGVADHSQSAFYAGGLTEGAIRRQHEEIAALDDPGGPRLFKGIESDIRPDGSLDYPPEVLDRFDFVIASIHSSMGQPREEMTRRIVRAMRDPHTTFLGHPTARLLLEREAVAVDIDAVLRAAAELAVAVEINANPRRLDLDWRHGRRVRELGLRTAIHPDAHAPEGIDDIRYGVDVARKAGLEPESIVSTYDAEEFARFLKRRRS